MLVTDTDTVSSLKRCLRKVTTFSLPANFASEINGGRLTPMSGLQAPEGDCVCTAQAASLTLSTTKSICACICI